MSAVELKQVCKAYGHDLVLENVDLKIEDNEFVLIDGESGSGKSTLLNLMGLLDAPDQGEILLHGQKLPRPYTGKAQEILKNEIGWLFQNYALIQDRTVEFNLKSVLSPASPDQHRKLMEKTLEIVGLQGALHKKVCTLSGGEQQRTAIARLLLKPCSVVLADEPTGSLDEMNRDRMIRLLKIMQKKGKTVIVVSHDPVFQQAVDRTVHLDDINQIHRRQMLSEGDPVQ